MEQNKIKVLHFTIANTGGGITKFVLRLWKYIDRERFHFDFVTMSKKLDFADQLEQEGCKIFYLSAYAEDDRKTFVEEVKHILKNDYDIVHLHTSWWRGFLLEQLAREAGVPKIIIHSHNTDVHIKENQSREDARRLHYEQRNLLTDKMATDFIACSEDASQWLYGERISKDKIRIIPYAIEVEEYQYDETVRDSYRSKLGLAPDDFVIGHVGRFAYQKNHEFLIDVFKDVAKINAKAKLILIGIGELEDKIKSQVHMYDLEDRVFFMEKREDVSSLMQAMDVFAFPSRFEGFGIVLIEAQAAGLKCVVSEEIPEIAKITDLVEFLPFDRELWVDRVLECSKGYKRRNTSDILESAGYGMNALAKKFEEIYCQGIRKCRE